MGYKAMTTPMESNLKLLSVASLILVDATMYCQMIGSLMYLTNPRNVHLIATNHIMRYLKGTIDYGLQYEVNQNINLEGYVDWDGSATIGRALWGFSLV